MGRSGDDFELADNRFGGVHDHDDRYAYNHDAESDNDYTTDFASPHVHEIPSYHYETVNFGREPVPVRVAETAPAVASSPPVRIGGGGEFNTTTDFGSSPAVRVTAPLSSPVRGTAPPPFSDAPQPFYSHHDNAQFVKTQIKLTDGGETPFPLPPPQEPPLVEPPHSVVVASAICHALASLLLLIALAVLASASQTIDMEFDSYTIVGLKLSYSSSTNTKYLLGTLIICTIYEFLQTIFSIIYICMEIQVRGYNSQYISYIGDQVIATLLLTAGAASAAYLKDLDDGGTCTVASKFCKQAIASTSFTFVTLLFVIANVIISSFSFYKSRL